MTILQSKPLVLKILAASHQINDDFEFFEMRIVSTPITARTRKLRCRWTPEEDQELQVMLHALP
jgi:hypothetical protein